jgi:hypothetical protein
VNTSDDTRLTLHRGIRAKATLHRTFPKNPSQDTDSQHEGQEKPEIEKWRLPEQLFGTRMQKEEKAPA